MPRIPASLGLLLVVAGFSHAARPYSLNPALDVPTVAGLAAFKFGSDRALARTRADNPWNPSLDRASIPGFDRWVIGNYSPVLSEMSSVVAAGILAVPVGVNVWDGLRGESAWAGLMVDAIILQEALMLSGSLSSFAKSFRLHSTPISYDPAVPEEEKRIPQNASSFFSNHTASAFATAVFSAYTFQARHPDSRLVPWVWGGTMAMAAGVGSMRILSGKHFPSDVLVGAAVGAACGYLLPKLHMGAGPLPKASGEGSPMSLEFGVAMPEGTSAVGPALSLRF